MAIKDFFKPSFGKVFLAVIFVVLASLYIYDYLLNNTAVCVAIGCGTVKEAARSELLSFYIPLFLIIGYIFSCLIVFVYRKIRGSLSLR